MLRQFSTKRVAGSFLFDWLGTLAMLLLAAILRPELGSLPRPAIELAEALEVTLGGAAPAVASTGTVPLAPGLFVLLALIWPLFFVAFSVYDGRQNPRLRAELRHVFLAICAATLALAGALFFTYRETSRLSILLFFLLDVTLLLGGRVLFWAYRRSHNGRRAAQHRKVLIVGAGQVGRRAAGQLQEYAWAELDLVGYADDDPAKQGKRYEGLPVLGTCDQLAPIIAQFGIDEAVLALPLRAHTRLVAVARELQGLMVRVHVIPDLFALSFPGASLDGFGGIPVIGLGQPGVHGLPRLAKRLFDIAACSLLLLVFWPLLLTIAVLIKLESPGPVIYRQQRIGESSKPFTLLKLRSMRAGVETISHQAYVARLIEENLSSEDVGDGSLKKEDDPRITRLGRVIRKTSLDELPQLFNVLRGEMSLVGPRPPLPYEVDVYQDWHKRRLETLPGITGWWQVKGRNRVSFDEMVRMDLYYMEQWSFWLDFRILLLTPWAMISGAGAG